MDVYETMQLVQCPSKVEKINKNKIKLEQICAGIIYIRCKLTHKDHNKVHRDGSHLTTEDSMKCGILVFLCLYFKPRC